MFFREKKSASRSYLQIVENRWEDGGSKQRVLMTLGRLDKLQESGHVDSLLRSGARFSEALLVREGKGEVGRLERFSKNRKEWSFSNLAQGYCNLHQG